MAQIVMPQLGEGVTEGTIARWLKEPGQHVDRYEAIAEVVTDKVNAEIPAPSEGVMGRHLVEEGAIVPVGAAICELDAGGASDPEPQEEAAVGAPSSAADGNAMAPDGPPPAAASGAPPPAAVERPAAGPPPAAAPVAPGPPASSAGNGGGAAAPPASSGAAAHDAQEAHRRDAVAAAAPPVSGDAEDGSADGAHGRVTPAVRMLAREHAVDLALLRGTGIGGRITKRDVLTHVQQRGAAPPPQAIPAATPSPAAASAPQPRVATAPAPAPAALGTDRLVPLTQARRAIAEHMVRSKATSPHAWTTVEVDMTGVARVRAREQRAFEEATGAHLTFLPFVARATVGALRRHPMLNSTWTDDGIVQRAAIHLGIAVALEDSLIVPVIRDADSLSIAGLARAARDLGERARAGRLRIDELTGGTFTLNNTGALGLVLTAPIINQPQAAILAMDAIVKRPVVTAGDAIAIRSVMNLSISFDHRIVDGLAAARFLRDVKQQLESVDESAPLG